MNNLQTFKFENNEIRTVLKNNEPWFVGKDVAETLGFANPRDAIKNHVYEDDKGVDIIDTLGGKQKMIIINESGLYALVFGSKLDNAKRFKHWVTSEVLPKIRKHGIYATDNVIDQIINNPEFGIKLLTSLKEERQARIEAERKNAILMHTNKTYTVTEIAKELGFKSAIALNKDLCKKKIQYKVNKTYVLYSKYAQMGLVSIKQQIMDNGREVYNRHFTQYGRDFLLKLYGEQG